MALRRLLGRAKERLLLPHAVLEAFEKVHWRFNDVDRRLHDMERRLRYLQEGVGRVESRQLAAPAGLSLQEREFRVFSQWGEDGIVDFLVRHVPIPRRLFVEFGVEGYDEANTRFLLVNHNWSGLVLDGDPAAVQRIRRQREYWLHNLKAVEAFVTRENIDALLTEHGVTGEIGLLSIDIDGMDWWVWDAVTVVQPAIVIVEYNARLGNDDAVTVPYDPAFDRRRAHHSILYYGASLRALHDLGARKGYDLVGCGSAGLNAFFVRRDLRPPAIPAVSPDEAFIAGQFCEAHDAEGRRVKMSEEEQRRLVRSLPLVRVDGGVARPPAAEGGPALAGR